MNDITKAFKKAAEERHEKLRVHFIKHTQFATVDYIERLKDIAKDEILEEWQETGRKDIGDIDTSVELDVNMQPF